MNPGDRRGRRVALTEAPLARLGAFAVAAALTGAAGWGLGALTHDGPDEPPPATAPAPTHGGHP